MPTPTDDEAKQRMAYICGGIALAMIIILVILVMSASRSDCKAHHKYPHKYPRKQGFHPVQVSPCGPPYGLDGDQYGVDVTGRNASGTTVWPATAYSRVAPRPSGVAKEGCCGGKDGFTPNDIAIERRRMQRDEAMGDWAASEDVPVYSRPYGNNAATFRAGIDRAGAMSPLQGHLSPLAFADVDSDFEPGTAYGEEAMKESMTSERRVMQNTLNASKTGLGSTRIDPRFEPGPRRMFWGGDAVYADGAAAGGPTMGSLTPSQFGAAPTMISGYVYGFGDGGYQQPQPEAIYTEQSRWNRPQ
jgi:hypothetical protein